MVEDASNAPESQPRSSSRIEPDPLPAWLPPWVHSVGVPVWISGPDACLRYVNSRAAELIRFGVTECRGRPCFGVVAGVDDGDRPFCVEDCPLVRSERQGDVLEPFTLLVGEPEHVREIKVLGIPLTDSDGIGPWIVHLAWPTDRHLRVEEYLTRVASRTAELERDERSLRLTVLTTREKEVLAHLAQDEDLFTVASKLFVSHATVRNHVQHILAKLNAHSILEAVAMHLLEADEPPRRPASR